MATFIVTATYQVNIDDDITSKEMEKIEAQRWQMFAKKYGIETLELKVDSA